LARGGQRRNQWRLEHEPDQTDLIEADLSGSDLFGVNLSKANLRSANLRSADLSNAKLGYSSKDKPFADQDNS
jgi:uncharacterized protein YjbI with pentapeptide repeats